MALLYLSGYLTISIYFHVLIKSLLHVLVALQYEASSYNIKKYIILRFHSWVPPALDARSHRHVRANPLHDPAFFHHSVLI